MTGRDGTRETRTTLPITSDVATVLACAWPRADCLVLRTRVAGRSTLGRNERKRLCGLIVAVYFRIPDSEPVLAGHYGKPHVTLPASRAARVIAEEDTPLGYEVGRCPGPGPRGDAGASRAPPGARRAAGQG